MQQAAALAQDNPGEQMETHKQYQKDFRTLLQTKIDAGEHLIVTGDFNQDLTDFSQPLVKIMRDLGLRNLIFVRHEGPYPSTFEHGDNSIDGMYGTQHVIMERGGYLPFDYKFSPHREIYGDFRIQNFLGSGLEHVVRPKGRKLQLQIPWIKKKFQEICETEVSYRRLDEKLLALQANAEKNKCLTNEEQVLYESYHAQQRRILAAADNGCCKTRNGKVPFSEEVNNARGAILCWDIIIRREQLKRQKNRPHASLVTHRVKRWNFKETWAGLTLEEMKEKRKQADDHYRELRPLADAKRKEFRMQLAEARAEEDNTEAEKHLKRIEHMERVNTTHSRIRASQGNKGAGGAAPYVEEVHNGVKVRITEKEPMEKSIETANIAKLQQTAPTPCRIEPLSTYFGEQGDLKKWEEIFQGTRRIPPEMDVEDGTRLFFEEVIKHKVPVVDMIIDEESYNLSWKQMKERTSSCPPTHFAHYMAPEIGSKMSQVNTCLAMIPMITGYIPDRWKECINTMLIKRIQNMSPDKLRLVTLLEPQYVHCTKDVGRTMMRNGEDAGLSSQMNNMEVESTKTHEHTALIKDCYSISFEYRKEP